MTQMCAGTQQKGPLVQQNKEKLPKKYQVMLTLGSCFSLVINLFIIVLFRGVNELIST